MREHLAVCRAWLKPALLVLGSLACALTWSTHALSDGIPAYVDRTGWHLLGERSQHAVVVLNNGKEHLFLQIALDDKIKDQEASRLVWVTPIPAAPSTVEVDIMKGFPSFWGAEPRGYIGSALRAGLALMGASQLWTLPGVMFAFVMRSAGGESSSASVVVHERLVREGVQVELISADSTDGLAAHLRTREVELPDAALKTLAPYTGSSGCFSVVRIVDLPTYRAAVSQHSFTPLGVEVSFPATEGFFPLVASSALPGESLEVVVTVAGFFEASKPAPAGLSTRHFVGRHEFTPEAASHVGIAPVSDNQPYTRFTVSGPPRSLQADLRFQLGAPLGTRIAGAWMTSPFGIYIGGALELISFLGLSALASVLARRALPNECRPSASRAAVMGLANVLTIVGVLVVSFRTVKKHELSGWRAVGFTAAFSAIFVGLLLVLALLTMGW